MRIGGLQTVLIVLLAPSALLAQNNDSVVKPQILSSVPDVRQIVVSSIEVTQRHWQARLHSTYVERDETRHLDTVGHVNSEEVDVSRTILVNGAPFEQLVERNGRPPSAEEDRKQKERLEKLKRETLEQRNERLHKQDEETLSLVREVPKAFNFQLVGEEIVNGRPAYVVQATPRPDYHAQGKYGGMLSKVAGRLWIDRQDLGWIKVDGQVIQPFSIGLFLARVLRGSHITMEQARVEDIWMPTQVEVRAAAKILFLKSLVIDRVLTYSEYRLAEVGVSTAIDPVSAIR